MAAITVGDRDFASAVREEIKRRKPDKGDDDRK
jgi:hypothetical protein